MNLIRFDRRAVILTGLIAALFILMTALAIHGSSIPIWDKEIPARPPDQRGWVFGDPKEIRSDEWLVQTPFSLSQFEQRFPVRNPSIGAHNDPIVLEVATSHFSTAFRPQTWGWLILGQERGFAFWWNLKVAGLALSSFLLLMLITRNRFWLAAAGTAWIYFSGFTQWWLSTNLPEMITAASLLFLALAYLFFVKETWQAVLSAIAVLFAAGWLCLNFYPPFQIPLGWLLVALAAGFFLEKERRQMVAGRWLARGAMLAGAGAALLLILLLFYADARETIDAVRQTVYPGQRTVGGGAMDLLQLFSGFTLAPLSERSFSPVLWDNASEAANFILFFPAVLFAAAWALARRQRIPAMTVSLLIYVVAMAAWAVIGFPGFLARITLMNFVTPERALIGIGLGSILLAVSFLSKADDGDESATGFVAPVIGSVLMLGLLLFLSYRYKSVDPDYFRWRGLILMSGYFAVVSWLLLTRRRLWFALAVLVVLGPYYLVNPLSQGLGPLIDNPVYQAVKQDSVSKPDARWVAYGDNLLGNLIIATGAEVIDGYKYTPDMELYRVFDPNGAAANIYNRYANVSFEEMDAGQKRPLFVLLYPDAFTIKADPCSEQLRALGVNLFAFAYQPKEASVACLAPLQDFPAGHTYLYERRS